MLASRALTRCSSVAIVEVYYSDARIGVNTLIRLVP